MNVMDVFTNWMLASGTSGGAETDTAGLSTLANQIFEYISYILIPILIVVGAAGIIYSVYLGVNLAKADSADKRQEAKSRMVNAIIGFVAIFVLVLLMYLFVSNVEAIFGWVEGSTPNQ